MESLTSLAAAAAGGNALAVADLLEAAWPDAFRIAWSVLGERTAAEDAAQEACARALTSIATLRNPGAFPAWFYKIVVNEAKRRRRHGDAAAVDEHLRSPAGPTHEDRIDLDRALQALDPPLRVATVLTYYFGLNGNEIARIVGASPATVRWRLFIARKRLRAMLRVPTTQSPPLTTGEITNEPQAVG